jgi:hypothetical protein
MLERWRSFPDAKYGKFRDEGTYWEEVEETVENYVRYMMMKQRSR